MTDPGEAYRIARNLAIDLLRKERDRTSDLVRERATQAVDVVSRLEAGARLDPDTLTAELLHLFSIRAGEVSILEDHDPTSHVSWLPSRRAQIQWRFWTRYARYLESDFGMSPEVVKELNALTDKILERIEDPERPGPWDRRGMVVGSVQSGKTANYIGLINKAIDAGYKLIIVLAGIHSNLRSQTQLRIDEGVLGFDTQKSRKLSSDSRWIGVGRLPGEQLVVHSLTSSADNGDFSKAVAENIGVMLGGNPVILVVKKNSRLLGNLIKWVLHVAGGDSLKQRTIANVPLLLIDDEADNASINVRERAGGAETSDSVSAINGRIREILSAFEKSIYVGYTATPFANIFINPSAQTEEHGEDIFPRSFIINVRAASNYVGPARLFGLDGDPDAGIPAQDNLPLIRELDDCADASVFPPKHGKNHVPAVLPPSLKMALRCFILACAARRARGQTKTHNSMLVHVTRFVNVQDRVVALIRNELESLQLRLAHGDGARTPTLREELQELWKTEFLPTGQAIGEDAGSPLTFGQLAGELHPAAAKIVVRPINGFARDALDYKEHEADGLSVVAVGGDKLSRGLTLEGLSVSYFLRSSRMYDTLMQMGRWFGYRAGYLDLCRLFTTRTLVTWYKHIALAEEELRREFDYMVAAGLTPKQYGLRVRTHPGGMIVTALNKMCHAQRLELSWAGVLVQTTQLSKREAQIVANAEATEQLIRGLDAPRTRKARETCVWTGASAERVAQFVEALELPPESARAGGRQLATFIRKQSEKAPAELTAWTVALISVSDAAPVHQRRLGGFEIGLVGRTPESQSATTFGLRKANILNPEDEALDFEGVRFDQDWFDEISDKEELDPDLEWLGEQIGREARAVALDLTLRWQGTDPPKVKLPSKGATKRPNGRVIRVLRRRRNGLLLIYPLIPPSSVRVADGAPEEPTGLDPSGMPVIGVALSFPTSNTALSVEYQVNKVWEAEVREDEQYED